MALKSIIRMLTKRPSYGLLGVTKEKEKHRLAPPHCTAVLVGLEGEEEKRYNVPDKFLPSILPVLIEDELDRKTDGPIRIYCSAAFFDQILEALRYDIDTLSLFAREEFRNLCR